MKKKKRASESGTPTGFRMKRSIVERIEEMIADFGGNVTKADVLNRALEEFLDKWDSTPLKERPAMLLPLHPRHDG